MLNRVPRHVNPVNLMLDDASAVPTLIQDQVVPEDIAATALQLMRAESTDRNRAIDALRRFRKAVGNPDAPSQASERILAMIGARGG